MLASDFFPYCLSITPLVHFNSSLMSPNRELHPHLSTLHSLDRSATAAGLLGVWPVVPPFWVVAAVMALIFRLMVKSSYRYWTFICPLCVAT